MQRIRNDLLYCLLFVGFAMPVFGQVDEAAEKIHITPLPQILNTNSLIDQPKEFRALQENVEAELSSATLGLRLPTLNKWIAEIRDSLIKPFDRIKVDTVMNNANAIVAIEVSTSLYTLTLTLGDGPDVLLNDLKQQFKTAIKPPISVLVNSFDSKTQVLLAAFLRALDKQGSLIGDIPSTVDTEVALQDLDKESDKESKKDLAEPFAKKISSGLETLLRKHLQNLVGPGKKIETISWLDFAKAVTGKSTAIDKEGQEWIAQFLNDKLNEARQALARLLDAGEHKVSRVIGTANKILADASLGVSFNPGENGAAGTLGLTWRPKECFQVGAVAAGLVGSSAEDSANALLAVQARIVCHGLELALVGSTYLGGDAREVGLGLSFRTNGTRPLGDLGWTLGGYYLSRGETHVDLTKDDPLNPEAYALTGSLRLIDFSSASITFGWVWNDGKSSKFFRDGKFFVTTSLPAYPKL